MSPSRFGAALLCLLVVLSTMLPVGRLFRCRMDGSLHLECCCDAAATSATEKTGDAHIGCQQGCCDVTLLRPHPHQVMPTAADHHMPVMQVCDVLPPVRGPPALLHPVLHVSAAFPGPLVAAWIPPPLRIRFCISLT